MSLLPVGISGEEAGGYQIERSLRFNSADSAYLNRTPGSAGNRKTWTWSGWVKRSKLGTAQWLVAVGGSSAEYTLIRFNSTDTLEYVRVVSSAIDAQKISNAVYRDVSSWYHIVVTEDAANTVARVYVNGSEVSYSTNDNPSNVNGAVNNTVVHTISGVLTGIGSGYLDNYLTEVNFIDGQALTPTDFGEFNPITGVWQPKPYTGTYGTNGFYLNFKDNSSTSALGTDYSGNGNNWTTNNFSVTAGAGNDSLVDSPTSFGTDTGAGGEVRGNYATLNPLDANGGTISNGNLEYSGVFATGVTQNGHGSRSTLKVPSSGKWYVEAANTTISGSGNSCYLAFTSSTQASSASGFSGTLTPFVGVDASVFNNKITFEWAGVSAGTADATQLFNTYASGDIVNFAVDFDAGKIWIGKNGTWYNSGNPAAGTNETSTFTAGTAAWAFWGEYVAASDNSNRSGVIANFGQRPFAYTAPSGFKALCTTNLPAPTIEKGEEYFDAKLDTGANIKATSEAVYTHQLAWIKDRANTNNHQLIDSVRGTSAVLQSNTTAAETTYTAPSGNSVAWVWNAPNTGVTNTDGTITSTVSANTTSGFSIVTYTGTGANATVGHGLGVAPAMVIVKNRSAAGFNWPVYHASISNTGVLLLNLTDSFTTATTVWNSTSTTSSVFSIGTNGSVNTNTSTYVAYCFAPVAGYSAFGSYTGNGSADGTFVYTGFRPRYVILKIASGTTGDWQIYDTQRDPYNVAGNFLFANTSGAQGTTIVLDFLSNGFKLRATGSGYNGNTNTYIFACFAENPFKYSLAR
jgi:hypothetical protein